MFRLHCLRGRDCGTFPAPGGRGRGAHDRWRARRSNGASLSPRTSPGTSSHLIRISGVLIIMISNTVKEAWSRRDERERTQSNDVGRAIHPRSSALQRSAPEPLISLPLYAYVLNIICNLTQHGRFAIKRLKASRSLANANLVASTSTRHSSRPRLPSAKASVSSYTWHGAQLCAALRHQQTYCQRLDKRCSRTSSTHLDAMNSICTHLQGSGDCRGPSAYSASLPDLPTPLLQLVLISAGSSAPAAACRELRRAFTSAMACPDLAAQFLMARHGPETALFHVYGSPTVRRMLLAQLQSAAARDAATDKLVRHLLRLGATPGVQVGPGRFGFPGRVGRRFASYSVSTCHPSGNMRCWHGRFALARTVTPHERPQLH